MIKDIKSECFRPTWSHMLGFGECMSIFSRRVASLAANLPFFMSSNSRNDSATGLNCVAVVMALTYVSLNSRS